MLLSFKKNRAFVNILADLEIFLSEAADKLDMDPSTLPSFSVVDNTRKFKNWNKIETVDTSNYIKFHRYDIDGTNKTTVSIPWSGYDTSKDISVQVFYDGKLLVPKNASASISGDYTIRAIADSSNFVAGYVIDFQLYLNNYGLSYLSGPVTILRTTTNLPTNVTAADLAIERYDVTLASQQNIALPWSAITDDDIRFDVYVNGVLWSEDLTASTGSDTNTYKTYSTYILFNKSVFGIVTFIRYRKVS